MRLYVVRMELDEDGWWVVTVPEIPGCRTQAKTTEQGMERIREALGLFVDDAEKAKLVEKVVLPAEIRKHIDQAKESRVKAETFAAEASDHIREAIDELTARHVGYREMGKLLELSHQRISQLRALVHRPVKRGAKGHRAASR